MINSRVLEEKQQSNNYSNKKLMTKNNYSNLVSDDQTIYITLIKVLLKSSTQSNDSDDENNETNNENQSNKKKLPKYLPVIIKLAETYYDRINTNDLFNELPANIPLAPFATYLNIVMEIANHK